MIKVAVRAINAKKPTVPSITIDENTTLRQALENAGIDCSTGMIALDGILLHVGGIDKTFADYGVTEKCWLCHVIKAEESPW